MDVVVSLFCFEYPATLKKTFTRSIIAQHLKEPQETTSNYNNDF